MFVKIRPLYLHMVICHVHGHRPTLMTLYSYLFQSHTMICPAYSHLKTRIATFSGEEEKAGEIAYFHS